MTDLLGYSTFFNRKKYNINIPSGISQRSLINALMGKLPLLPKSSPIALWNGTGSKKEADQLPAT